MFHPLKDQTDHLGESGLGCCLVDEVSTSKVDVVHSPDSLKKCSFMDFACAGGNSSEQSLTRTQ